MDTNKNCNDSTIDHSSVADESISSAGAESVENLTSPGPSTNDVNRKRRGSSEIFNWKLLKKNVTDHNQLAAEEEPGTRGCSKSTAETQNSDPKIEDCGPKDKENDSHAEEMDDEQEMVASVGDQVSLNGLLFIRNSNNALIVTFTAFEGGGFIV